MLIDFLKKLWVVCFTNNPYKIKRFKELYIEPIGREIDHPESLSAILKHEQGEITNYLLPLTTYQENIKERYVDAKHRFKPSGIFKSPDRYVYSISNGCILGQSGIIYDADKRSFIDESTKEWTVNLKKSSFINAVHLPQKKHLKGVASHLSH